MTRMICPRCGNPSRSTGKKWKYNGLDVEQHICDSCEKKFNAYYKNGKFLRMIPKPK